MKKGTIKSFDASTGDGMITPDESAKDVYFCSHSVEGGTDWVHPGVPVQYELYPGNGSEPEAEVVVLSKVESQSRASVGVGRKLKRQRVRLKGNKGANLK